MKTYNIDCGYIINYVRNICLNNKRISSLFVTRASALTTTQRTTVPTVEHACSLKRNIFLPKQCAVAENLLWVLLVAARANASMSD